MKIFAFDPKKNRQVLAGEYSSEEKTFYKKVTAKHFFIKLKTYAIQETIINQLLLLGCETIVIISKNKQYISTLQNWLNSPVYDFGHGKQFFLKNE